MTHQHFTAAAVGSELSRCSDCHHLFTYPRGHCSQCGSLSITSEPIRDRGTVYAVTVVRAHPNPEFNAMAPYAVAYVDLDLGGRVLTRLTTPHAASVRIGDRVEVGPPAAIPATHDRSPNATPPVAPFGTAAQEEQVGR